jgi:transposase
LRAGRKVQGCALSEAQVRFLTRIVSQSSDWRERERAQTILYFGQGKSGKEISELQAIHLDTVYDRRKRWRERGCESLQDRARCGGPRKLDEDMRVQVIQWAEQEALSAPDLMLKVQEQYGIKVHANTIKAFLGQAGFVWKRTRHYVKKNAMCSASSKPKPISSNC